MKKILLISYNGVMTPPIGSYNGVMIPSMDNMDMYVSILNNNNINIYDINAMEKLKEIYDIYILYDPRYVNYDIRKFVIEILKQRFPYVTVYIRDGQNFVSTEKGDYSVMTVQQFIYKHYDDVIDIIGCTDDDAILFDSIIEIVSYCDIDKCSNYTLFCPQDASPYCIDDANRVLARDGGHGVIAEFEFLPCLSQH